MTETLFWWSKSIYCIINAVDFLLFRFFDHQHIKLSLFVEELFFFFNLKTFHHSSKLPDWSVSLEMQNCSFRYDTTAALDPKCVCVCSAKRWNRILLGHCELALFHINFHRELSDRRCSLDALWSLTLACLRELFLCFCLVAQGAQLSFLLFLAP